MALSASVIADAKAGDFTAIAALTTATDGMVASIAREFANKVATRGAHAADTAEEFMSVGRLALWEAVSGYNEEHASCASAETYLYKRIRGAIADAAYAERNQGADADAMRTFMACLKQADGDAYMAERLCRVFPDQRRRLGADRAEAARLAYAGTRSLDAPTGESSEELTLGALIPGFDVPDDLIEAADLNSAQRKARIAMVNTVLDSMSPVRREVLKARTGFPGYARDLAPAEVPDAVLPTVGRLLSAQAEKDAWRQGCAIFAERFPLSQAYPVRAA